MNPAAGYSGTTLARKLGIKQGSRVVVLGSPPEFEQLLGELPAGVRIRHTDDFVIATGRDRACGPVDVIVAFFTAPRQLERSLPALREALDPAGGLWLAWPKRTSGIASELGERTVRELGLALGLVDNKVCAIDERWSGLRFVVRLRDRA